MKYIFYDYKKVICGKSKIMYHGKWYVVLYAEYDFVIIKLQGKYAKVDKYDVEDCSYENTIVKIDEYGNEQIVVRKGSDLKEIIREGELYISCNFDIDEIDACKQGFDLYKSVNLRTYFLSGMLVKYNLFSDNKLLYEQFNKFISMISDLPLGDTRRGINICMVDSFESWSFSLINGILDKYNIFTDKDAIRCLSLDFVIDLLYILEN